MSEQTKVDVVIVGGGFTGMSAAYELTRAGKSVVVVEADETVGGLAGSFEINGASIEKFYHHWFSSDTAVIQFLRDLNLEEFLEFKKSSTGMYFAQNFFKLSTPWDLLTFRPLPLLDRIRLGILTLRARSVRNWQLLESLTAKEWLLQLGGRRVFEVVWEPLLEGKFGDFGKEVSAVWFWNKLKLRGGSRNTKGSEELAYLSGGFSRITEAVERQIVESGGLLVRNFKVQTIKKVNNEWITSNGDKAFLSQRVVCTTALPITKSFIQEWADRSYVESLDQIKYLANTCLVLVLKRSLSDTYWLNVNDPGFPFVGVIEHTNFEDASVYGGKKVVYLSKYLERHNDLYSMNASELLDFSYPYLKAMFPEFEREWVVDTYVWRAEYSQPLVSRHYSTIIPEEDTPYPGLHLCSMAQIYPEDRGTNYAIEKGRAIGARLARST